MIFFIHCGLVLSEYFICAEEKTEKPYHYYVRHSYDHYEVRECVRVFVKNSQSRIMVFSKSSPGKEMLEHN